MSLACYALGFYDGKQHCSSALSNPKVRLVSDNRFSMNTVVQPNSHRIDSSSVNLENAVDKIAAYIAVYFISLID